MKRPFGGELAFEDQLGIPDEAQLVIDTQAENDDLENMLNLDEINFEDRPDSSNGAFVMNSNNQFVHKANAINSFLLQQTKIRTTSDRLGRCFQSGTKKSNTASAMAPLEDIHLKLQETILSLVRFKKGIYKI